MASWPLSGTARHTRILKVFSAFVCIAGLFPGRTMVGVLLRQGVFHFFSRKTSIRIPNLGDEFKIKERVQRNEKFVAGVQYRIFKIALMF
jgi:hypothetical protein